MVTAVLAVLKDNRRYTIDDIQEQLKEKHYVDLLNASIYQIEKEVELRKVCPRWIPCLSIDTYKDSSTEIATIK